MNMNETPESGAESLPEEAANWPQWKKEAYLKGEPIEIEVPNYSSSEVKEEEKAIDPELEKKFELVKKLKDTGIKIEMVDALPNLAIYDEGEKTLRVRRDASFDFVRDYVENAVFMEQEGIDKLPDVNRNDYISLEDDENEKPKEDDDEAEEPFKDHLRDLDVAGYKPRSEDDIEKEKAELTAKISAAQNLDELYAVLREVGRVPVTSIGRFYEAQRVIADIERIKDLIAEGADISHDSMIWGDITRRFGLRDKVKELILGKQEEKAEADQSEIIPEEKEVEVSSVKPEEAKAPEKEQVIEKIPQTEKLVFGPEEIKNVIASQLGGKATINRLDISETGDGVRLDAELDTGMMGGKIILNGVIKNSGDGIMVGDLNIEARGYVKSMIEKNLSNFTPAIKNYFEKQKGKSVVGIKIVGSSLEVEFKNTSQSDESEPEPKIEAPAEKNPEQTETPSQQENVNPESEEELDDFQKLEELRKQKAKAEVAFKKAHLYVGGNGALVNPLKLGFKMDRAIEGSLNLEDALHLTEDSYRSQRDLVAQKIKESLIEEAGDNLTPEQEAELQSKINDTLFEELVKKENEAYVAALREARGDTLTNKALEEAKNLLSNKAVRWYLDLGKWQRRGVNLALGTIAGVAVGAGAGTLGVAGYVGKKVVSGVAGVAAGEWANKKWSIEELEQKKKEEEEALKVDNSLSLTEQSARYEEIQKRYKKERLKMMAKRTGVTLAAGAGTGLLSNLAEGALGGFVGTGAARNTIEAQGTKSGTVEPAPKPSPEATPTKTPTGEPVKPVVATSEPIKPSTPETAPGVKVESKSFFTNPSILKHQNVEGDSVWKILDKTLENEDKFKGLTEAQKTFVVSNFTNKIMENPETYGVGKGGNIEIGKQTDLTKLFEDSKEAYSVFEKAKEITSGSLREKTILENSAKIATWLKEHPDESLSEDRVSEILNTKPKGFFTGEQAKEFVSKRIMPESGASPLGSELPETPEFTQNELDAFENDGVQLPKEVEQNIETSPKAEVVDEAVVKKQNGNADKVINIAEARAKLEEEIGEYKQRLAELEGSKNSVVRNPNIERSMVSDGQVAAQVEEAFRSGVDDIYGKSGLLGFGRIAGVDTPEWRQMARLPAAKVVEYYTGNSNDSGLPLEVADMLFKSKKHAGFAKEMLGLLEQTNGTIKPFENESVEQFMKRVAAYVFKSNLQSKAA